MSAHSVLAPSSAARTVQCPWSVRAEAAIPESDDRTDALGGEAAHWAGARMLAGEDPAAGETAPNGVVLTDEMIDGAEVYATYVERKLAEHGKTLVDGAIESPVDIPSVHPECFGTPDFRAWWTEGVMPTLFVVDFKFGHRYVEAFGNYQLAAYASGAVSAAGKSFADVHVCLAVVQPRSYHRSGPAREWNAIGARIQPYVDRFRDAAHEALRPAPTARTGPGCRDCRARFQCPTLQAAGYEAIDEAQRQTPLELTPAAAGLELRKLHAASERMAARVSGLEAQLTATIRRGETVPGWAVEHAGSRQRWTVPAAQVDVMGRMLGLTLLKPAEAITPKQAIAKGLPASVVEMCSEAPRGGPVLVAVDGVALERVFGS